jgi:serine phosphatase RsbU (regulator of sigma subunit)
VPEIDRVTRDSQLALAPGDLVVLYTDGLTEARAAAPPPGAGARRAGQQFGDAQLLAVLEEVRGEAPEVVRDRLVAAARAWQPVLEDDLTVVVIRRRAD